MRMDRESTSAKRARKGCMVEKYWVSCKWSILVMLRFRAWNRFRFQILSFFQKIVIPIPILVPTAAGIDSIVESVPGLEWIPIKEWAFTK